MKGIQPHAEGCLLTVWVQPRAARNQIIGWHEDALKVRLTAPPVEGAANDLCRRFLAKRFGLARCDVEITAGRQARRKHLLLRGLTPEQVKARLEGEQKRA